MADGSGSTTGGTSQVEGTASVAKAMGPLNSRVRAIVLVAIARGAIGTSDPAETVAKWHDHVALVLQDISLEYGTEAMRTSADYAVAVLEAGLIYPGQELDAFLREVAGAVRVTSRELSKGTPFGI